MTRTVLIAFSLCVISLMPPVSEAADKPIAKKPSAEGIAFFEKKIRPVLVKHCYECHSAKSKKLKGDLLLDTREGTLRGGEDGHAVVPGNLEESLIITALEHGDYEMPKEKLSDAVIANFVKWVKMGAPDPRVNKGPELAEKGVDFEAGRKLWIFQQPKKAAPPKVKDASWPKDDIDRYILSSLEAKGIKPVADADRLTLLRRVYYDLTGLPPTPMQLHAFLKDKSPKALETVIDQLLASPQFGERWGRHWLDVVRYAESTGQERNYTYPYAWKYRDYVIQSFNDNTPYDHFIKQQIAGDILPAKDAAERRENVIATGMLAIGIKMLNERDKEKFAREVVDDQIDVTTRAFMGITASCARCHAHKFDPIPQSDYYALAGIFRSTQTFYGTTASQGNRQAGRLFNLDESNPDANKPVARNKKNASQRNVAIRAYKALQKRYQVEQANLTRVSLRMKKLREEGKFLPKKERESYLALKNRVAKLRIEFSAAKKKAYGDNGPKQTGDLAMAVREAPVPADVKFLTRGELDAPGDVVPRGFITVCNSFEVPEIKQGSGRLELAQWMTDPDNPLTARVAANRVWQHLFGYGIVRSVNNFGKMGTPPTHPELLDSLAVSLIEDNWSLKGLIKRVMLSRTYQLSSAPDAAAFEIDPENKLVWHMNRRRLEAEAMRDTVLAASGKLDRTPGEGSIVMKVGDNDIGRSASTSRFAVANNKRSVYLPILRGVVPEMLATFDFPEPSNMGGQREVTTVPIQALYMMNSQFISQQSQLMGSRLTKNEMSDVEKVNWAYKLSLARPATEAERARTILFIEEAGDNKAVAWAGFCQMLFSSAEFRFLD